MPEGPNYVIVEKFGDEHDVTGKELAPGIYEKVEVVDDPFAQKGTYDYRGPENSHHWVVEPTEDPLPEATP